MADVTVRAISPDQHEPVMHYFDMVAYADNPNWSRCFCMERLAENYESSTKQQNRAARSELILSAKANGLVAYRLGRIVGWCHAAPKNELVNVEGEKDPRSARSSASSSRRTSVGRASRRRCWMPRSITSGSAG